VGLLFDVGATRTAAIDTRIAQFSTVVRKLLRANAMAHSPGNAMAKKPFFVSFA
jgi:hypothetical protein